ncbi:MAG: hypothetical protein QOE03_2377 [Micromonosporaceae bacterium]|nr:hypothetical protein [Micromonosporaceae bacterium]
MNVRPVRLLTAAAALTLVLSSTACGSSHAKEKRLPIKREADVVAMLRSYGDATAGIIPVPGWVEMRWHRPVLPAGRCQLLMY